MIGLIGPDSTTKALFASQRISLDGSLPSNIFRHFPITIYKYGNDLILCCSCMVTRAKYVANNYVSTALACNIYHDAHLMRTNIRSWTLPDER